MASSKVVAIGKPLNVLAVIHDWPDLTSAISVKHQPHIESCIFGSNENPLYLGACDLLA